MNKSKAPADVAPGFKSHVVEIRKGSDILKGLATFATNNPNYTPDDPKPKALANNQRLDINANISNSKIVIQITHLKTSRKSAVAKAVFHSSLKTTGAQRG